MDLPGTERDESPLIRSGSLSFAGVDQAIEQGNFAAASTGLVDLTQETDRVRASQINKERWQLNYREAAIYLEEGKNNEKFGTHPANQDALPAYLIAHHRFFHIVDIIASILLLSLAIVEKPAVDDIEVPIAAHASLEIIGILVLGIDVFVKVRWQGITTFLRHKRSLLKSVLLVVMLCESITVIVRQTSHVRVTRALRPLFLLDTYYCNGIRRFVRQLLLSLPRIIELLFLLLFLMLLFSLLGFYLFSSGKNSENFSTVQDSFFSLFVLLTTANYPDVMMPAYSENRASAVFFVVYIIVELYFLMNLFLAVVYDTFTSLEKDKVRKLLLHERSACQYAFRLLTSSRYPESISLPHFCGLVKCCKPRARNEELYLMFKTLNTSKSGSLSLKEFYSIYSVLGLSWKEQSSSKPWFYRLPHIPFRILSGLHTMVTSRWFDYFIYCLIGGNFIAILYDAIVISVNRTHAPQKQGNLSLADTSWHSVMFSALYGVEIVLKMTGLGPLNYFNDGWNAFDFVVTMIGIAGLLGSIFGRNFFYFVVLRPLRLLRVFKARKRYRDVLGTLFLLTDRLGSVTLTLILLYYFYGVIGMECFSTYDMRNCCQNTSVEMYYAYSPNNTSQGYYYLNNFDNILVSGVTLFELTVVNNWYIIMEGYAAVTTDWSRIYFMTFYVITMVVMTVVVAFILEAFMFKMEYRRQVLDNDNVDYVIHEQSLSVEEVQMINNVKVEIWSGSLIRDAAADPAPSNQYFFTGRKKRGKIESSIQMYANDIKRWIAEAESAPSAGSCASNENSTVEANPTDI